MSRLRSNVERKIKIAFYDSKPYDLEFFSGSKFDINFIKTHLNEDTAKLCNGAEAVCIFVNDQANEKSLSILADQGIKLIALRCAGYNNIDLKAAKALGMTVVRVPAYSPYAVAEHAVALLLTLNRKTHKAYFRTRDNNFTINGLMGFDLHEKSVGVIGVGKIGQVLVKILNGFGMKVLAFDKFPNKVLEKELNFTYVSLDELFKCSDIISLNCPLTPETTHLINERAIDLMKKDVMIINTGRGKLIDTKALIRGLKNKKIGAAGLDVYEEESEYFFEDCSTNVLTDDVLARLLSFNNVLITSHQGFFTKEAVNNIVETTFQNITDYFFENKKTNEVLLLP